MPKKWKIKKAKNIIIKLYIGRETKRRWKGPRSRDYISNTSTQLYSFLRASFFWLRVSAFFPFPFEFLSAFESCTSKRLLNRYRKTGWKC